jgi:hypothetical protein
MALTAIARQPRLRLSRCSKTGRCRALPPRGAQPDAKSTPTTFGLVAFCLVLGDGGDPSKRLNRFSSFFCAGVRTLSQERWMRQMTALASHQSRDHSPAAPSVHANALRRHSSRPCLSAINGRSEPKFDSLVCGPSVVTSQISGAASQVHLTDKPLVALCNLIAYTGTGLSYRHFELDFPSPPIFALLFVRAASDEATHNGHAGLTCLPNILMTGG